MTQKQNLHELQQRAGKGPVVPGSPLYRTLLLAAQRIARKLLTGRDPAKLDQKPQCKKKKGSQQHAD